ncbi:MAG: hypothetical protein IKC03_01385 [Oscillospiraceae bacterium]|nr:hypothetical protein [Oscillospiraceae bacterium]
MSELFLKIINMSISASWLVLVVLAFRFLFRKAPKWVNVLLWGIVAVRLICPFAIESSVSLVPDSVGNGELVSEWADGYIDDIDIHHPGSVYYDAAVGAGREPISDGEGGYYVVTKHDQLGEPDTIENTVIPILSVIWVSGVILLAIYTAVSYWRLQRRVSEAVILRENIFQSENAGSPFVLGIIKPRIYLPYHMDQETLHHVIAHEQAHIRRRDHWWKPLGFLLLTIHWFNPIMWLAYVLLCRDIELACDEKVIKEMGSEQRADYTQALVSCSVTRRTVAACPLAFGEVGVKERVKSVMNYKKPTFWVVALALVTCAVVAVCFLTDPVERNESLDQYSLRIGVTGVKEIQISRPGSSGGIVNADGSLFRKGEIVWLDESDLRGVSITAIDQNGNVVYSLSVPPNASDDEISKLVESDSWIVAPNKTFQSSTAPQRQAIYETLTLLFRNDEELATAIEESTGYLGMGVGDTTSNERPADAMLRERYADLFTSSGLDAFLARDDAYRFPTYIHHAAVTPRLDALTLEQAEESNAYRFTLTVFCDDQAFPIVGSAKFDGMLLEKFHLNTDLWEVFLIEQAARIDQSSSLDAAIRSAIIEVNRHPKDPAGLYHCASFVLLDKEEISGTPAVGSTDHVGVVTVYGLALYQGYTLADDRIYEETGSHIPVAITFDVLNGKYSLKEYWQPGDGSYYVSDIRDKFPNKSEKEALDTQKYIRAQIQNCYAQAIEFGGVNTTTAIEELFTTIESSPLQSSNPSDYIDEHYIEYRELTYYGQYTLRYCFDQFLKGGQTGLRGHLMRAVIDDIAPESKLQIQTMTGQEYFDEWKATAFQLSEQHGMDWIKGNQPAVYILLQMMGEYVIELDNVSALVSEKGYTGEDFKEELLGQFNENIIHSWGKPDFDVSGFGSQLGHPGWAQIWYLDEENHQRITLYLNEKGYVEDILIDTTENN